VKILKYIVFIIIKFGVNWSVMVGLMLRERGYMIWLWCGKCIYFFWYVILVV